MGTAGDARGTEGLVASECFLETKGMGMLDAKGGIEYLSLVKVKTGKSSGSVLALGLGH